MGKIEKKLAEERSFAGEAHSASAGGSCFGCSRQMGNGEVKVLLPRYVQERDPCASKGTAGRRFMCLSCYNRLRPLAPARTPRISRIGLIQATC
jgi:hypothetical protein